MKIDIQLHKNLQKMSFAMINKDRKHMEISKPIHNKTQFVIVGGFLSFIKCLLQ